ncbi:MAG: esterase-like activity of phytase family protein [Chloroflexota bacterium]|nr:esterase-like activity of phytase family protein [Chloroflexota bacterium]
MKRLFGGLFPLKSLSVVSLAVARKVPLAGRLEVILAMVVIVALGLGTSPVRAQDDGRARLVGWAVLAADTFADGPASGARINPAEANGRTVPFPRHPVQGISSVLSAGADRYWVLSDNGYGAKGNSDDYNLCVYTVRPTFKTGAGAGAGRGEVLGFFELRDPDRRVPWPIVNQTTTQRILTGADFDVESFRRAPDGTFWFGEELGPYLLHTDAGGRLLEPPFPLPVPDVLRDAARGLPFVQSPDHPDFVALPDADARNAASNLPSSRGFEGMALSADGTRLYTLLEGSLRDDPLRTRLLISEFDIANRRYTGRTVWYRLEDPEHAIGELTAVNESEYLVIERDGGQGTAARFKGVYLTNLAQPDAQGVAPKVLVADLMNVADPAGISDLTGPGAAGAIGLGGTFTMPFVTIESVLIADPSTLLIVNDNNYPFSVGRRPNATNAPDDNEFVLLRLARPLRVTAREARPAGSGAPAVGLPRTGGPTTPAAGRSAGAGTARFQVGLIGDLLYTAEEVAKYPALMASMDTAPLAFVVHDGDFKSGSSLCDDATFEQRLALFQSSAHPFIFIPGDNDWTDCHRENNGAYDPLERLAKLRGMFFPGNRTLGRRTLPLQRQSDDPGYATYRENVRWTHGNVMFVGLNVQGSNNNLGRTPEQDQEYLERNYANLTWLRVAFDLAKRNGNRGVMVVIQANPDFELRPEQRTGFNDFLGALQEETLNYSGQVVLVHGDSHNFQINKPMFATTTNRRVENFTRVETFGTPDVHWVRATIDAATANVFAFEPVIIPQNVVDHRR